MFPFTLYSIPLFSFVSEISTLSSKYFAIVSWSCEPIFESILKSAIQLGIIVIGWLRVFFLIIATANNFEVDVPIYLYQIIYDIQLL